MAALTKKQKWGVGGGGLIWAAEGWNNGASAFEECALRTAKSMWSWLERRVGRRPSFSG